MKQLFEIYINQRLEAIIPLFSITTYTKCKNERNIHPFTNRMKQSFHNPLAIPPLLLYPPMPQTALLRLKI